MASATPLPASPNRKIAFVASLAAMALGATPAHAGTDAPEDTGADIVVTGTPAPAIGTKVATPRIAGDQHDIAQSVTVLDKELLGAQGATSLADALRNVPGITLGGAEGGQIGNNINLNGFTARTDIFLDGFRDRGQYYRDTFALDSVEVLMGPSSMLFGRGSTGGAINQVPHQATLKPGAQIATSVNTNGMVRGTAGIDQPLSSTAALRVDGMWQDGAPTTRTAMTNRDYGFAPTLRMGIGTPTEVTVSGLVQHNRDRPDYGVSPLNGAPVSVPRNTVYGYDTDRTIQDVTAGSAAITHHFSPQVSLRNQVQYNAVTTDAVETAANTIGTIGSNGFAVLTPAATSSLPLAMLGVRLQSHDRVIHDTSLFDQAELKAEFGTGPLRHTLLVGSELGRDTYRNQLYYRNGTCNGVALNDVLAEAGVKWSVYGTSSGFHLFMNPQNRDITPHGFDPYAASMEELKTQDSRLNNRMRLAMLVGGVDLNPRLGGFTSSTHTAQDVADTIAAFTEALRMLKTEGELPN